MSIRFAEPYFLILLLLIPMTFIFMRRIKGLSKIRRGFVFGLRSMMLMCIILAASEIELTQKSRELTVLYSLDVSESIPADLMKESINFVDKALKNQDSESKSGLIVFGAEPSLESTPQENFKISKIESVVEKDKTNIASALKLCLAAFPKHTQKRIVLLSDGNENSDRAMDAAEMIKNNNTQILTYPLIYNKKIDVSLQKILTPQRAAIEAPFEVRIIAASPENTTGRLSLFEDNKLVATEEIKLTGGKKNLFTITRSLASPGVHAYRAEITSNNDARPENNSGSAFTVSYGEPFILFVDGNSDEHSYLADVLIAEKFKINRIPPQDLPQSLEEMQNYDAVILSNVHASNISEKQMKMLESATHDLGIGLLMIGGENSFGAGGWQDTPVEKALPVSMDIKQKKILPNGALAIILHTCEIPDGNKWARDISLAALNVLSWHDYMGIIYYGAPVSGQVDENDGNDSNPYGEKWLFKLQEAKNKLYMKNLIMRVEPGDMPSFEPTMKMAYEGLSKLNCQVKHIVIISDGDPPQPNKALSQKIRNDKITISTIVIAPHSPRDVETMRDVANWGGGNFYEPASSNELPKIFIKEASIVRKSVIFEEPFKPLMKQWSETLSGFAKDEFPQLNGYVTATKKDLAVECLTSHHDDPILCEWQYGIGKAAAFTSDAKEKWGSEWIKWNKYEKFWTQLIRSILRENASNNLEISTTIENGKGNVIIEAIDDNGDYMNFLQFDGGVINPDMNKAPLNMRQTAPGRYEGTFDVKKIGSYISSLSVKDKNGKGIYITSGASLSYSPEYSDIKSNESLLSSLAESTGGKMIKDASEIYKHNLPSGAQPEPMWDIFVMLAMLILPFDIFARRVMFEPAEARAYLLRYINKFTGKEGAPSGEELDKKISRLKKVKDKTAEDFGKKDFKENAEQKTFAQQLRETKVKNKESEFAHLDKVGATDKIKPEPKAPETPIVTPPKEASAFDRLKEAKERAKKKLSDDNNGKSKDEKTK